MRNSSQKLAKALGETNYSINMPSDDSMRSSDNLKKTNRGDDSPGKGTSSKFVHQQYLLEKSLSGFISFCFSYSAIAPITSIFLVFQFGLRTGGPAMITWGWIVNSFFSMCIVASMAEICSVYPAAGSVYHWTVVQMPSQKWGPVLGYIAGWFNFIGSMACDASLAMGMSSILSACLNLMVIENKEASTSLQVLLSIIVLLLWALKNKLSLSNQGSFAVFSAIFQFLSTMIIALIVVVYSQKLSSNQFVFTQYNNDTGFSDEGNWKAYVCSVGILTAIYGLTGYEGGATMAEETHQAGEEAPRAMIESLVISAITGFMLIVGLLYSCRNQIEEIINGETSQVVINILAISFDSVSSDGKEDQSPIVPVLITIVFLLNAFFNGFNHTTITTRMGYALARDNALPFSNWLNYISKDSKTPDRVTIFMFIIESLFCILPLISKTAFEAVTQITSIGFQLSYVIPIAIRLCLKCSKYSDDVIQGSFTLGRFSGITQLLSVIWLIATSAILFFPQSQDPVDGITMENFNYTSIVVGCFMVIAIFYWYAGGLKKNFTGPDTFHQLNEQQ